MKEFLNKKALENTRFSSDTIGPLAYLAHKMSGKGTYVLNIYEDNVLLSRSIIDCSKEHKATSKNIDVSQIRPNENLPKLRINDTQGFLVFYNSKAFSKARIVIKKDEEVEFDSLKPSKGDYYILNLLRPGSYKLQSKSLNTDMDVNIKYPTLATAKEDRLRKSLTLTADKVKEEKQLSVFPNQGLIFELDSFLRDIDIQFVKEDVPVVGRSIREQLKLQARQLIKKRDDLVNPKIYRKYQWKAG